MKRRIALVSLQIPAIFLAGVLWGDQLDNTIVLIPAILLLVAATFCFYAWALSLAIWQYQEGRVSGMRDTEAFFTERRTGNG